MSPVITLCMDCFFFPATMDLMKTLDGDQLISGHPRVQFYCWPSIDRNECWPSIDRNSFICDSVLNL